MADAAAQRRPWPRSFITHTEALLRGVSEGTLPRAGTATTGSCDELVVASRLVVRPVQDHVAR